VVVDNNGIWVSSPRALRYRLCRINYTLCHLDSITNLCKSRFNLFNSHDPSMMAIQVRNKWVVEIMEPGCRPFCQMSYPLVLGPEKSYSNLGQCQIGGNLVNWNNWPETTNITMIKHWVINEASELPAARMEASLWVSNFKSSTAAPHIYLSWAWVFFCIVCLVVYLNAG